MYKNYIFDLYGTLIDIRTDEWSEEPWEEFAAWLTGNGMPYTGSEVKALYDNEVNRLTSVKTKYTSPEIDIIPVFEVICKKHRPDITDEEVWKAGEQFRIITTKMIKLYPNTKKVLTGLKKAGKKVYLLSNAQRVFTWQELVKTGIVDDFDDILYHQMKAARNRILSFIKNLSISIILI